MSLKQAALFLSFLLFMAGLLAPWAVFFYSIFSQDVSGTIISAAAIILMFTLYQVFKDELEKFARKATRFPDKTTPGSKEEKS